MANSYSVDKSINCISDFPFRIADSHYAKKGLTTVAHIHDDLELIYVMAGDFEVYLDGARHEFSQGDLVVINSREVHMINALSEKESRYICVRFALENLQMVGAKTDTNKYIFPFMINVPYQQKIFKKNELARYDIHRFMIEALDEYEEKGFGYELAVKCNILKILVAVLRLRGMCDDDKIVNFAERTNDISKALKYIDENYASDISMEQIADMCSMSYSYFSRVFKDLTNLNFNQYLQNVRLREAEYMLAMTNTPITEIAFDCGFSSSSYFVSKFRHQKGITPKQYRNMMRDKRR